MIQHSIWKEIDSMRREMETMFSDIASFAPVWSPVSQLLNGTGGRYPSLQMCDDDEAIFVEAVIPGVDPASLDLSVERNLLTLSGEKPQRFGDQEPQSFHRKERFAGKFTRQMRLPVEVDAEQVSAEYANGVLKVKLPKAEKAKPKQISIKAA